MSNGLEMFVRPEMHMQLTTSQECLGHFLPSQTFGIQPINTKQYDWLRHHSSRINLFVSAIASYIGNLDFWGLYTGMTKIDTQESQITLSTLTQSSPVYQIPL